MGEDVAQMESLSGGWVADLTAMLLVISIQNPFRLVGSTMKRTKCEVSKIPALD